MAKLLALSSTSLLVIRPKLASCTGIGAAHALQALCSKPNCLNNTIFSAPSSPLFFSTTSTRYPLQYDMVINRPAIPPPPRTRRRLDRPETAASSSDADSSEVVEPEREPSFESWIDKKLSTDSEMDRSKRKYYRKREKRMYGFDSEDEHRRNDDGFVELKPEVVEFDRLHEREQELYFYDAFAYPWEKDKHYKMVYQLEKKYFPDQCLDKAFLEPGELEVKAAKSKGKSRTKVGGEKKGVNDEEEDKRLVFFEEQQKDGEISVKDVKNELTEKKVEDFFKDLKKAPGKSVVEVEPYFVSRSSELPPQWDGSNGTVVLVNKPKGNSYT